MKKRMIWLLLIGQLLLNMTLSSSAPTYSFTQVPGQANAYNLDIYCNSSSCSLDGFAFSGATLATNQNYAVFQAALNQTITTHMPVVGKFNASGTSISFSQNGSTLATYSAATPITVIEWNISGQPYSQNVLTANKNGIINVRLVAAGRQTATVLSPITIRSGEQLQSLKIRSVDGDSTQMNPYLNQHYPSPSYQNTPWEWTILIDHINSLSGGNGGQINGLITDNGKRLVFECPNQANNGEEISYWVGISLPTKIQEIEYEIAGKTKPRKIKVTDGNDIGVCMVVQNSTNSLSAQPVVTSNPNFIYIDIPTEFWPLKDVYFNGIEFSSARGNNFSLLWQELIGLRLGQEISGTLFGTAGIYLPNIGGFAFVGSTFSSLTVQPFLTNVSKQPALITTLAKAGDQIVFRLMEKINYITGNPSKINGSTLASMTFYDTEGVAAELDSNNFKKTMMTVNAIHVTDVEAGYFFNYKGGYRPNISACANAAVLLDQISNATIDEVVTLGYNGSIKVTLNSGIVPSNDTTAFCPKFTIDYNWAEDYDGMEDTDIYLMHRKFTFNTYNNETLLNLKCFQYRFVPNGSQAPYDTTLYRKIYKPAIVQNDYVIWNEGTTMPAKAFTVTCPLPSS